MRESLIQRSVLLSGSSKTMVAGSTKFCDFKLFNLYMIIIPVIGSSWFNNLSDDGGEHGRLSTLELICSGKCRMVLLRKLGL